ncbi:MAG: putative amidophosphoribosyltransferase [Chlamydiales bacterium]|jgi:ComF family protein|nr:putative amidophosphoribosyltransferase [Chlamydiales bacterium]
MKLIHNSRVFKACNLAIKILYQAYAQCLHFIYPACCLHCNQNLEAVEGPFLCKTCIQELVPINPLSCCEYCFTELEDFSDLVKCSCRQELSVYCRKAAVFDYTGPASSLVKKFKYSNKPYLSQSLAGYMALQYLKLNWPTIDTIVPVPQSWLRRLDRGYNQSFLLAEQLGKILNVPVQQALIKQSGDYPQAALSLRQRKNLHNKSQIIANRKIDLSDKIVLVVDDVVTTGTTLERCGNALLDLCPKALYTLTVCRAL